MSDEPNNDEQDERSARRADRRNDNDDATGMRELTHTRLSTLERQMVGVQKDVKEVRDNSRELIQMFTTVKSGVRIATWAAHLVKWLLIIAGGITALKLGLTRWLGIGS